MSIKTFTALLILAFAWTSCKNDAATSGTTQSEPATTEVTPAADPSAAMGADPSATMGADANMAIQPISPATPAAATTQTAGTAGMKNPAHGEPGHVCGVPVGQVLDGKTATAPTTVVPTPTTAAPKPTAAPAAGNAKVAPGMNPPHGQPGHRCDISVGEPLNSKPKQ